MKVAALDLGTNSFLCLIAEVESGEIKKILSDQVQIVRLGQDVNKTRQFHPEALERARKCLTEFKKTIDLHKPEKILAMATSAARDVKNADELFQIGRDLQIPIQIIPGEKEAEITFKGSISGLPKDSRRLAVIDIGGGSTEIIAGTHDLILGGESINIGGVRLTEQYFPTQPPSLEQVHQFQNHVNEKLEPLLEKIRQYKVDELVAVAGTPTELAAATIGEFNVQKIDGYQFTNEGLQIWIDKFMQTTATERVEQLKIAKGRADVILAGTLILKSILNGLQKPTVTVSTRGVRFGVALELAKGF